MTPTVVRGLDVTGHKVTKACDGLKGYTPTRHVVETVITC